MRNEKKPGTRGFAKSSGRGRTTVVRKSTEQIDARLQVILDQIPAVVWTTDSSLVITSSLGGGLSGLGLKPNQLVGMHLYEYLESSDPNYRPIAAHIAALKGESTEYEIEFHGRFFQVRVDALRDSAGIPTGVIGLASDITDKRLAEKETNETEENFRKVFEEGPLGIQIVGIDLRIIKPNPAMCKMLGYAEPELRGMTIRDISHPDDLPKSMENANYIMRGLTDWFTQEKRYIRKDRTVIWGRANIAVVRDSGGMPAYFIGMIEDITERKRARDELDQKVSLLEATLESTADGILVVGADSKVASFNQKFVDMWKIPKELMDRMDDDELLAFVLNQLKTPEAFLNRVRELYGKHDETSYDMIEFKDGKIFERYSQPRRVAGVYAGRVWSFRDITEKRMAEEELRVRTARTISYQSKLLELSKMDFSNLELALGRMTEVDSQALDVSRVSVWFFTEDRTEIFCVDLFDRYKKSHESRMRLKTSDFPTYCKAIDESLTIAADDARTDVRTCEFKGSYLEPLGIHSMMDVPIRCGGKVVGIICHEHRKPRHWTLEDQDFAASVADLASIVIETSNRLKAEEELRQLNLTLEQRIEERTRELLLSNAELDSFAYSVSHDLRAPLRAIQGFSQALLEDYASSLDDTGKDFAARIMNGAHRMDQLIQDLLSYSRLSRTEIKLQPVDSGEVLDEALTSMQQEISAAKAKINVVKPLPVVIGNYAVLTQVFTNIISNGLKFVAPNVEPEITIWSDLRGPVARLSVKDNGIGIEKEHLDRIFRIFERLHSVEKFPGTGIGLAIVRKAVERFGGKLGVDSTPGTGSTFWFEVLLWQKDNKT